MDRVLDDVAEVLITKRRQLAQLTLEQQQTSAAASAGHVPPSQRLESLIVQLSGDNEDAVLAVLKEIHALGHLNAAGFSTLAAVTLRPLVQATIASAPDPAAGLMAALPLLERVRRWTDIPSDGVRPYSWLVWEVVVEGVLHGLWARPDASERAIAALYTIVWPHLPEDVRITERCALLPRVATQDLWVEVAPELLRAGAGPMGDAITHDALDTIEAAITRRETARVPLAPEDVDLLAARLAATLPDPTSTTDARPWLSLARRVPSVASLFQATLGRTLLGMVWGGHVREAWGMTEQWVAVGAGTGLDEWLEATIVPAIARHLKVG